MTVVNGTIKKKIEEDLFMKKIIKSLAVVLSFAMILTVIAPVSCVQAANKTALNKTKVTLNAGKSTTLKVNNATKKVTWSSSDEDVATVTYKGKKKAAVRAINEGTCKITARCNGKKYICKVTVKGKVSHGTIEGNVTYHYNRYKGYVPDTGARVSIWDNGMLIAYTKVDGNGNYKIQHVPTGSYDLLISSYNCSSEYVLNDWDNIISEYGEDYWKFLNVAGNLYKDTVKVYKNESTDVSFAFPYTDF